jgi:predicted NodU family carbamoyl transferase
MMSALSGVILGINSGIHKHDGAAALLRDGQLVAMAEEERFTRDKHAFGRPAISAIRACLEAGKLDLGAVDAIAIGWDEALYARTLGLAFDELEFLTRLFPDASASQLRRLDVRYIPHHVAHAASTHWASGFEDSAILVIDGRGEQSSTTLARGEASAIHILSQSDLRHSLGNYYAVSSEWSGLSYWGAGKFMGLAAYGQPVQPIPLRTTADGYVFEGIKPPHYHARRQYYYQQVVALYRSYETHNFPFTRGDGREPLAYANFAASVQRSLEEIVLHLAAILKRETGARYLTLAGGVALNCTMNRRLAQSGLFDAVFVPPATHDAGAALGAALYRWRTECPGGAAFTMEHACWGAHFSDSEIRSALDAAGLPYSALDDGELLDRVADRLARHEIVAWFSGRAEVGPRALGARSLLGHPGRRANLLRINQIKQRELWRPLAPSVQVEHAERFFEPVAANLEFMTVATQVRDSERRLVPAVVHVDGSTRPHVVRNAANPRYHALLGKFAERSGLPILINTSFNVKGEPIAYSPADAIRAFVASPDIDALAIGGFLVARRRT